MKKVLLILSLIPLSLFSRNQVISKESNSSVIVDLENQIQYATLTFNSFHIKKESVFILTTDQKEATLKLQNSHGIDILIRIEYFQKTVPLSIFINGISGHLTITENIGNQTKTEAIATTDTCLLPRPISCSLEDLTYIVNNGSLVVYIPI